MRKHAEQQRLWRSPSRFCVVPAGRRSGKTELGKRKAVVAAIGATRFPDSRFALCAPTHLQAKQIFWKDVKAFVPPDLVVNKSESELTLTLWNGAEIIVCGLDVPARIEGPPLDGCVLDEYGNMKEEVWTEHVRPMLSERGGWCWFIGVPEGRNHYYDLYCDAKEDESGTWDAFTWTMAEVLPLYRGEEEARRELDAMARDLDKLTFDQEANASFVSFEGRAYYDFCADNVRDGLRERYNKDADLVMCFDFNRKPGVAVLIQENENLGTCVIGEVHIPSNSNTPAVCRKLIADGWGKHEGRVLIYGDATGGAKGTQTTRGSDWEQIRDELHDALGQQMKFRVPLANPYERIRVNAMNSRICAKDQTRKLLVDPKHAPHVVRDFEGVRCKKDGSGEIDKKRDERLTHPTDAIGYYVVKRWPGLSKHRTTVEQV